MPEKVDFNISETKIKKDKNNYLVKSKHKNKE